MSIVSILCTYIIAMDVLLVSNLYIHTQILLSTMCVGYLYNNGTTIVDNILYKITRLWIHTSMDVIVISILLYMIIIYKKSIGIQYNMWIKITILLLYVVCTINIICYIDMEKNITGYIDSAKVYAISTNILAYIHPLMLWHSLVLIIITQSIMHTEYVWHIKKNTYMLIYMYRINNAAIILGGIWASSLYGWGGFWTWDQIEIIIIQHLILIIYMIHIDRLNGLIIWWMIYNIWYFLYTKTNVMKSIHSFNDTNILDHNANIYWLNYLIICILIYYVKTEVYNTLHSIRTYILLYIIMCILLLVVTINNNSQLWEKSTFLPWQLINEMVMPIFIIIICWKSISDYRKKKWIQIIHTIELIKITALSFTIIAMKLTIKKKWILYVYICLFIIIFTNIMHNRRHIIQNVHHIYPLWILLIALLYTSSYFTTTQIIFNHCYYSQTSNLLLLITNEIVNYINEYQIMNKYIIHNSIQHIQEITDKKQSIMKQNIDFLLMEDTILTIGTKKIFSSDMLIWNMHTFISDTKIVADMLYTIIIYNTIKINKWKR